MGSIIDRALNLINDNLKDQMSSFPDPIAVKQMARGGHVLEDDYPTHYLPHVGRQVMADGGKPRGFEGRVMAPAPVEPEPVEAAPAPVDEGLTAYHGTPHAFDKFDISKIGTGEGAQAYGHGLYFAENEDVARMYRDALARPYYKTSTGENVEQKYGADTLEAFNSVGGDPQAVRETIDRLRRNVRANLDDFGVSDISKLKPLYEGDLASNTIEAAKRADNLESLLKSGDVELADTGHMYEVRLNAGPEHLLDWDKPLSEQHPEVKKAFNMAVHPIKDEDDQMIHELFGDDVAKTSLDLFSRSKGSQAYNTFADKLKSHEEASKRLLDAGIRGIRYRDAGSRGKDGESGTYNYVIFDPQHIKTVRRYAEGGGIKAYFMHAPEEMGERIVKAHGGAITPIELGGRDLESEARRLILWSYAVAPLMNPQAPHRAEGGSVSEMAIGGGTFRGKKPPNIKNLAKVKDKFIYHSGTVDDLENMKDYLEPRHGGWVRELAEHSGYDDPDELLEKSTPLVWMSDNPTWVTSKVARKLGKSHDQVTIDDIRQHGHVAVIPRKGDHAENVWKIGDEGLDNGPYSNVKNLNGKETKAYNTDLFDFDEGKEPFGVERNEYVSAQDIEPLFHLTGDDLVNFLRETNNLKQSRAKGGRAYPVAMPTEIKEDLKAGKAKKRELSPQEFLDESDPLHIGKGDRHIIHSFENHIKSGDHLGPLKLYEGGHQDGRHRANAAKALGIKKVPVIDYRKATGGSVDPTQDAIDTARNLTPMGFYSAAAEAASKIPQRAPIDQIINKLKGSPNVKGEELDWSGVRDAFAGQKSVDPAQVAQHLQANLPQIQETVYGYDPKTKMKTNIKPGYQEYSTPGGYNYREVLLHLPERIDIAGSKKVADFVRSMQERHGERWLSKITPDEERQYDDLIKIQEESEKGLDYQSHHWGQYGSSRPAVKNILAHLRITDRGMHSFGYPEALHLEEVQSDWGQHKREGEDVPDGPHIGSTEGWTDLALKRALREAAQGKYKKLTWTPGEDQAERYGLDKSFSEMHYSPDSRELFAKGHEGVEDIHEKVHPEALHSFIGKELASKLLNQPVGENTNSHFLHGDTIQSLTGNGLKMEQKGMRDFYDRMIPNRLQKLVSKLDPEAKVQLYGHKIFVPEEEGSEEGEYKKVHSLEITPKLRAAILKGLPAYADGGEVSESPDNWEDAFHATHQDVQNFDLSKAGSATTVGGGKAERAIFLTNDPQNAHTYLGGQFVKRENAPYTEDIGRGVGRHYTEGANIMPLRINTKDFDEWDYGGNLYDADHMKQMIKEARKNKAPGIKIENIKDQGYMGLGSGKKTTTYVVLDPSRVRSKFAKFDPKKSKKRDLMAADGGPVVKRAFEVLSKLPR